MSTHISTFLNIRIGTRVGVRLDMPVCYMKIAAVDCPRKINTTKACISLVAGQASRRIYGHVCRHARGHVCGDVYAHGRGNVRIDIRIDSLRPT